MTTPAPTFRSLDQLTGNRVFFTALRDADARIAERAELYRLLDEIRAQVDELVAENRDLAARVARCDECAECAS